MFEKVELFSLIGAAGTLELILGGLLMIGLFSRIVAFVLAGEMAFAYFMGHFPKGFYPLLNNGSLAIAFCFACLYLATSAGPDQRRRRDRQEVTDQELAGIVIASQRVARMRAR